MWHDDDSGLDLRARPDLACHYHDGLVVVDFKTTRAVTARAFGRDAAEWGYHRQAAWYWDAVEEMGYVVHGFAFLCVDKSPAHECHVYELPAEALEHGRRQNLRSRRELFWRLERNDWTSPTADQIQVIDLPVWAYHEE